LLAKRQSGFSGGASLNSYSSQAGAAGSGPNLLLRQTPGLSPLTRGGGDERPPPRSATSPLVGPAAPSGDAARRQLERRGSKVLTTSSSFPN